MEKIYFLTKTDKLIYEDYIYALVDEDIIIPIKDEDLNQLQLF